MLDKSFLISDDHPSLEGHFPGYPIVPGVITLDHIVDGLLAQCPKAKLSGFPKVKFLYPLLPNSKAIVSYSMKKNGLYQFKCLHKEKIIIIGQIRLVLINDKTND